MKKGLKAYYLEITRDRLDTLEYLEKEENKKKEEIEGEKQGKLNRIKCRLSDSIKILNLSVRAYNALCRDGRSEIWTLYIMSYEEMMKIRNLGEKAANEIVLALKEVCDITLLHQNNEDELKNRAQICRDLGLIKEEIKKPIWIPRYLREEFTPSRYKSEG